MSRKKANSKKKRAQKSHFEKHCERIENYLEGINDNPMICTTHAIAKRLEEAYDIALHPVEAVNRQVGLFMFEIIAD